MLLLPTWQVESALRMAALGFRGLRVLGFGFRVFWVQVFLGFGVQDFWVLGLGSGVEGLSCALSMPGSGRLRA